VLSACRCSGVGRGEANDYIEFYTENLFCFTTEGWRFIGTYLTTVIPFLDSFV
jgi:hypothetical protein